jgi:hypothetical protein
MFVGMVRAFETGGLQGVLAQGPPGDGRVTFVRPDAWAPSYRVPDARWPEAWS